VLFHAPCVQFQTTSTSFVALLKVVAYGWLQLKLSKNSAEIRNLAVELHGRLGAFSKHLATSGKKLNESVDAYNKAVGSLESRVLPSTRRFTELGVDSGKPIETPQAIDLSARDIKPLKSVTQENNPEENNPDENKTDMSDNRGAGLDSEAG
jgi:DNA anti-recombination protein RmuC